MEGNNVEDATGRENGLYLASRCTWERCWLRVRTGQMGCLIRPFAGGGRQAAWLWRCFGGRGETSLIRLSPGRWLSRTGLTSTRVLPTHNSAMVGRLGERFWPVFLPF